MPGDVFTDHHPHLISYASKDISELPPRAIVDINQLQRGVNSLYLLGKEHPDKVIVLDGTVPEVYADAARIISDCSAEDFNSDNGRFYKNVEQLRTRCESFEQVWLESKSKTPNSFLGSCVDMGKDVVSDVAKDAVK